eukprot:3482931-Prorocentrum_lima.AAC.1
MRPVRGAKKIGRPPAVGGPYFGSSHTWQVALVPVSAWANDNCQALIVQKTVSSGIGHDMIPRRY